MSNHSTTRQLSTSTLDDLSTIKIKKVVDDLLRVLSPKEKDIVKRRFGLDRPRKETLQEVGTSHGLTRERIRQIENSIVAGRLRKQKDTKKDLNALKDFVIELIEEHGGVMEKEYLFRLLDRVSSHRNTDEEIRKNQWDFLLSQIFADDIKEIKRSPKFKNSYQLKTQELDHLEEMAEELVKEIRNLKQILKIEELLGVVTRLSSYSKHKDRIHREKGMDIDHLLDENIFYTPQERDIAHQYRSLYSVLQTIKDIEPNKFGDWGHREWNEISPKTINDKIYLILKNKGKPMHFTELAEHINSIGFDGKKANPATIHNELILDDKYVLIGRGMYGLKEWGFKEGTVADVIREILATENRPMTKEEIVQRVLENRMVKRSTINLALFNRPEFQKTPDNKYVLQED